MEKNKTSEREDESFDDQILLGPIPFEVTRVSGEEISQQQELLTKEYPGFEIIKCFDDSDCVRANLLRGFAVVPLEMPNVIDITFYIVKIKRQVEDVNDSDPLPKGLVDCFRSVGLDVDVGDDKKFEPVLVCVNKSFNSIEVVKSVPWKELLMVILFSSITEELANDAETV